MSRLLSFDGQDSRRYPRIKKEEKARGEGAVGGGGTAELHEPTY